MVYTHSNVLKCAQVARFAPNEQNYGNFATTAKIWALMFFLLPFSTYNKITRKYRHKQFSIQYKQMNIIF